MELIWNRIVTHALLVFMILLFLGVGEKGVMVDGSSARNGGGKEV